MKTKFACADFTFPLLSHVHALDLIAHCGFTGADLGLFGGRSHLKPAQELAAPSRTGRKLRKILQDRGLKAADVFLQMAVSFEPLAINQPIPSRRRKARDWFRRTLEYAAALDCKHVTTVPGIVFPEGRDSSLQRAADELAWRVEQSQAAGIVFGTEAHTGSILATPEETLELLARVPGLTLTLDYTHFTRAGVPDERIEPLVRHASHFHARHAAQARLQCNQRQGTIDYGRVLRAMKASGYSGWIGLEYVWIDWEQMNESDNLSETIQLRDWLARQAAKL